MKRETNLPKVATDQGVKATLLGIFVNLGLALIKCSAGLLGNSFALVGDGLVPQVAEVLVHVESEEELTINIDPSCSPS